MGADATGLEVKSIWPLGAVVLGPSPRASQVACSAATCRAEVLLVLPLACRRDPCVMDNLIPGWTADRAGPGDHGGERLKLFWSALAGYCPPKIAQVAPKQSRRESCRVPCISLEGQCAQVATWTKGSPSQGLCCGWASAGTMVSCVWLNNRVN